MTALDRMALVLTGTLLVCAASAAPPRPGPNATACELLRVPATGSPAADRLIRPDPRSPAQEASAAVALARDPAAVTRAPQPSSTCTATGDGISVTLTVWHYANRRDAAHDYQGWNCGGDRRRITVTPIDHGCVWGSQHIFGLGNQSAEVSLGEAEVMVGPTVLRATVIRQGVATNAPALVTDIVTVAAKRLHRH